MEEHVIAHFLMNIMYIDSTNSFFYVQCHMYIHYTYSVGRYGCWQC